MPDTATDTPTLKSVLDGTTPVPPTPLHQLPAVKEAIANIWQRAQNGQSRGEASIVVHGLRPDGSPVIRQIADTGDYSKETFSLMPGDKAILHTHPNVMDAKPSDADMAIANKNGIDVYTVSNRGVYHYAKGMKQPELVENDLSFLNK